MEQESLAKHVGRLVRHLRIDAGLSQEQFANECGLHRTVIALTLLTFCFLTRLMLFSPGKR